VVLGNRAVLSVGFLCGSRERRLPSVSATYLAVPYRVSVIERLLPILGSIPIFL